VTSLPNGFAQPTIDAGDLRLRPFEPTDEPAVARAMLDLGILRWAAGASVVTAPEAARARVWLEQRLGGWTHGNAILAVTAAADGTLLGSVSLRDVNRIPDQATLAYWVSPEFRGRGIAPRALDAVARWAFGTIRLHRLSLNHVTVNAASCRVAGKAGFRLEGTMREEFVEPGGTRHDSHLHARLATDPVDRP
jgi:RimJ/RimL family protein N-acetyltransferase